MGVANNLQKGFDNLLKQAGRQVMIRYFSGAVDSVYDDELDLVISGAEFFGSAVVMPLSNRRGSEDSILLEQGKLQDGDMKIYVSGNTLFTGSDHMAKVFLGSKTLLATVPSYSLVDTGTYAPQVEGINVYKRAFIRLLPTGSFIGE